MNRKVVLSGVLAIGAVCCVSSPSSAQMWVGTEQATWASGYPFTTLPASDPRSNTFNVHSLGQGYSMSSSRSRPENSTETDMGFASAEGTYKTTWAWSGSPTPYWTLKITTSTTASATVFGGYSSNTGTNDPGAAAAQTLIAPVSANTYGYGYYNHISNNGTPVDQNVTTTGTITSSSQGHTVAAVNTPTQSFAASIYLSWTRTNVY